MAPSRKIMPRLHLRVTGAAEADPLAYRPVTVRVKSPVSPAS